MNRTRMAASLALGAFAYLFPLSYMNQQKKEGKVWSWGFGRNG